MKIRTVLLGSVLAVCGLVLAQEPPQPAVAAAGLVRTVTGVPIPGATVRLTHLDSGRAWVSWTDENGRFELPGLPAGRYRVEAQQLGFEPATIESEFSSGAEPSKAAELTLRIARPSSPASQAPPTGQAAPKEAPPEAAASTPQPAAPDSRPATAPPARTGAAQPGPQGRSTPQNMIEQMRQRLAQSRFQQVETAGQNGASAPANSELGANAGMDAGPLGEVASAESFLIQGSVGRGATAGMDASGGFMGFGPFGMMGGGPFGPGMEFQGPGGMPMGPFPGGPGGMPGMAPGVLVVPQGGSGGAPQGGAGGQRPRPGAGRQGQAQPQQQAQRGGRAGSPQQGQPQQAQTSGGGFGQGMETLWGMQRILRQQANRLRFGFYNRYGNSVWDARPYSLTAPDPQKIDVYRESFGVNFGGPLRIPKIYDGREKTFIFVNYDVGRNRNPVDTFATVPLPEERLGDFTARGVQLFDPNSNLSGPRTPLGSVIPPGMLNPAAVGLLEFVPLPNLPGTAQNFHLQTRTPQSTDRLNVRVLHTISQKLNFQATYSLSSTRSASVQALPALGGRSSALGQNVMLGLTQQYTARLIHDSRVMWSRNRTNSLNRFAFDRDIAGSLGITGISADPVNYGMPRIDFTNFTDANDPVPGLRRNQTFRFLDNVSYNRPKHALRAGVEIRRMQNNTRTDPVARGAFTFTGLMTSQLNAQGRPVPGTGFDFADFLIGLPQSTTVRFGSSSVYFRNWGFVGYAQDDWRVHPRFTLTYGLRYEAVTPPVELFDKLANLDLNSEITAVALVLPGQDAPFSGQLPRSLVRGDYNNWSPRLGIAWRPKVKRSTTVRGGYGLFYNFWIYNQLSASMANQPPHAQAQTRLTSSSRLLTLQNGFPPEPPGTVPNTIAVDPNYRIGYAQIWNVSIETQLVRNVVTEITYTGTKGTHLDLLRSPNRAVPGGPLDTELRRRIPNAPGFTYDSSGASSIYHALQLRLQKRMARGWMLQGIYTFGKSLDNASTIGGGAQVVVQDDNNFDAERGLSSFDIRHQFRANWVWELPFGERKRWARAGWPARLLSNWSVNGNATFTTGTPFTARLLGSASNNSGTGNNFSERPDQVANPNLSPSERSPLHFFNTAAFTLPPAGHFGNAARNTIAGPGSVVFNVSAGRFFRFGKDNQRRAEFRWEVQNLCNTPNFSGLNTAVNSTNYGRVQGTRPMRKMDLQIRVNF